MVWRKENKCEHNSKVEEGGGKEDEVPAHSAAKRAVSKDGERGDQWEERGAAVQQLRDRVLPRMEGEGAEGGECNCGHVEPPGMFQWGGGGKEGAKVFESNNGANELDERGQRGGGLLEAKKSKKWPFAVKLWHLPSARSGGRSEVYCC